MPLVLVKENGTGLANANAYADRADGDAFHDGHLYAAAWTGATNADKEKALVMATRLIDAQYQFGGTRLKPEQGLQWPREDCVDLDSAGESVASDVVPKPVVSATCELARELLIVDRTASPPGEGLRYHNTGTDQLGYDKRDTRPIISAVAQAMLNKFGTMLSRKSGIVKLVRA